MNKISLFVGVVGLLIGTVAARQQMPRSEERGVSKARYLDLVEDAVGAYTYDRMNGYLARVKREGIREHGFARLAANLAILVAHGRRPDDRALVKALMDEACGQMATALTAHGQAGHAAGNDFSVKEVVLALIELEKARIFPPEVTRGWRAAIARCVPETTYSCQPKIGDPVAHNWCVFGAASEQVRRYAGLGGSEAFTERYFADQIRFFDANGMYRDPHQPMVYDFVTRLQFMLALEYGYDGPSRAALEACFLKSAEPTLMMQSATGEIPYGGRSNQFLHCETHYAAVCEWYARWFKARGNPILAARFRCAARRAVESLSHWLDRPGYVHVKNRFPLSSHQGCEGYGYFDKYMVTMGSWACLGYLFADESIPAAADSYPEDSFVFSTSPDFHRTFLRAGDYTAQIDWDADLPYDSNGLGRLQRKGAPSVVALSVPFPANISKPNYVTGLTNATPLAVLPGWRTEGTWEYACLTPYRLVSSASENGHARTVWEIPRTGREPLAWTVDLSADGLTLTLAGRVREELALTIPAFRFDGQSYAEQVRRDRTLCVTWDGWTSRWESSGEMYDTGLLYGNRNGYSLRYEARGTGTLTLKVSIVKVEE